jgi:hypothetical protein
MIRITSKQHNFLRCRVAHPKGTTEYPDDAFTPEQLKILQAEPKLTVEIVEKIEDPEEVERPDLRVREIKKQLKEIGVEFPSRAKKAELRELLAEKMSGLQGAG